MILKVVYDNRTCAADLRGAWGFACLIESGEERILFDVGSEGRLLLENMRLMGIDPAGLTRIVISHDDWDHADGLAELLPRCAEPEVVVLPSFSESVLRVARRAARTRLLAEPARVVEDVWSTGPLPRINPDTESGDEQALVLVGCEGLLLLTGCAHPGLVPLIQACRDNLGQAPRLIMGGFHLKDHTEAEVANVIGELRALGVERIAPCHCTGERAMEQLAAAFYTNHIETAAGTVLEWP